MQDNHQLSQQEFTALLDEEMSVRHKKEVMKNLTPKLTDRFAYIMRVMDEVFGRFTKWFDFDNEHEDRQGFFDADAYSVVTRYTGEFSQPKPLIEEFIQQHGYDDSFPTTWFKEDFEQVLKEQLQQFLQVRQEQLKQEQANQKARDQQINQVREQIRSKLSAEELCYIDFKPNHLVARALGVLRREAKKQARIRYNEEQRQLRLARQATSSVKDA